MILENNARFVLTGDSVTDCGRDYNSTPASNNSFGDGYVNLLHAYLCANYPQKNIFVANKGVNGNTVKRLRARWETDILALNPSWVAVLIGINDVWRHFDAAFEHTECVDITEYETLYRELIEMTLPKVKGMFLLSPFMMEECEENKMKVMTRKYAGVVKKLAEEYHIPYLDIQSEVDAFLKQKSSYYLSADRVHPNLTGHMILAKTIWRELIKDE